jgi:predicted TIM-barrel fold metal-dependent hydrolase
MMLATREERMTDRTGRKVSFRGCTCCDETLTFSRRRALGAAAGFALAGFAAARAEAQALAPAKIPIVDVHHHLAPPAFLDELKRHNTEERILTAWTPEKSIADMDAAGVATAILSITEPGVWLGGDEEAVRVARACNEYGAKLVADSHGRFGLFAVLPLPSVDGSLREIEYALDTLKADGVGVVTSYGDKWLGDKAFAPVMDELNRRKAVVYSHPIQPACCRNLVTDVPRAVVEFGADTTRTIASLVFSGTAARCPDIKFIFSHGGGAMPFLIERFVRRKEFTDKFSTGAKPFLEQFYYDTAQIADPAPLAALTKVVPVTHILFGSDFPFRSAADYIDPLKQFFNDADLRKIESDNARVLLPRLKAA